MKKIGKLSRVDFQVIILTVSLLVASGLAFFVMAGAVSRNSHYQHMQRRAQGLHKALSDDAVVMQLQLEAAAVLDSIERPSLLLAELEHLRPISDASHVYFSWLHNGQWYNYPQSISVQDNPAVERPDASEPARPDGDTLPPADDAVKPFLLQALQSGSMVATPGVITTESDRVFGFYFPISDPQGNPAAVLAVEYSTAALGKANNRIFLGMLWIVAASSLVALMIALYRFRAISNLRHRSTYNVDQMTGFKSRNTFDLDLANINNRRGYESLTFYYIDLNDLKTMNDTLGHDAGDCYLCDMAEIIRQTFDKNDIVYRVGGDEFCVLSFSHVRVKARAVCQRFLENIRRFNQEKNHNYSAAIGFAVFNYEMDADASTTRVRAEMNMYENKRRMKSGLEPILDDSLAVARQQRRQWEHAATDRFRSKLPSSEGDQDP